MTATILRMLRVGCARMKMPESRAPGPIHHAPWSSRFKTMWYRGAFAYELQVGPVVLQWFYQPFNPPGLRFGRRYAGRGFFGHRLHIWQDRFWR